jgi:hypothetical protein
MVDHALPGTMQSLNVLLLDTFLWHEGNMRLSRGSADCLRIVTVVFCRRTNGLTY